MYIEIPVQWTIHKMDSTFKQCDKYIIIQDLLDCQYNLHILHYCIQYISDINICISKEYKLYWINSNGINLYVLTSIHSQMKYCL